MAMGACHPSAMGGLARRDFHVRRSARDRYGIDEVLLGLRGDLAVADLAAIRVLAQRMNEARPPEAPGVSAGEIGALGLLHEVGHLLVMRQAAAGGPTMATAMREVRRDLRDDLDRLLDRFAAAFPGVGPEPEPALARLEELLLTRVANENPAIGPLRELVDDRILADGTRYQEAIAGLEEAFDAGAVLDPGDGTKTSLVDLLRAPARHAPTSLSGQLRYVRDTWGVAARLGPRIAHRPARHRDRDHGRGGTLTPPAVRRRRRTAARSIHPSFGGLADEPERFSVDSAWMPRLVLVAKSTYVWLDQLSRTFQRDIRTLDAVPDEALDRLASWGVTGLWLIGLWQRSKASERIKRMRGNPDAVASAYSLDDYRIADDLGGEGAYADLRDRAWARGIRLASDMVPNHMGIDSRWVIDHPEWFLSLPRPPYPAYTFTGPDLAPDEPAGIVLEDHYWNDSDAAVVFKRFDRASGDEQFIYHGNDGTSFPWNDTAQLDFLKADVREQVVQTILDVARRFPVIRFDAAMVLAKRHVRRLWWPEPGATDSIPSRAQYAMSQAEFDKRDAEGVLARGRRPGRSRGARHPAARRGVLDARGLLRADARHAPGLQQRVHAHAPRRERGRLPEAHPRDPRVRSGDPQAIRQLHDQPGRRDGARAVRQGRQVLRRGDGPRDAARAADARPRPGRGVRREVRHGVPPRDARRAAGPLAGGATRARDLPVAPPAGLVRRGARLPDVRLPHRRRRDR